MPICLDTGPRFFGTKLSENIAETPEGFRICKNAVIARTGFQTYLVSEITDSEGLLDDRKGSDEVEIYRSPEEVFRPATIASFEGKPFTVRHPEELLTPDNTNQHACGHVQNVRKGSEALDDGNWPLLADVVVTDADAIRAIDGGQRELSCGYSYRLAKEGERLEQREILGNHVALVESARAGAEARIQDEALPRKGLIVNMRKFLMGLGFKQFAKDAEPEKIAEAASAMHAFDSEEMSEGEQHERERRQAADKPRAKDDDKRKGFHDALDKMLDEMGGAEQNQDADIGELKRLLNQFLSEEASEPYHEGDEMPEESEDTEFFTGKAGYVQPIRGSKGYNGKKTSGDADPEEEQEETHGEDAEIVEPEPDLPASERPKSMFDAKFALTLLKTFRPLVAKSNDKKLQKQFDQMITAVKAAVTPAGKGAGTYGKFRAAASKASDEAEKSRNDIKNWKPRVSAAEMAAQQNDAIYAAHLRKPIAAKK